MTSVIQNLEWLLFYDFVSSEDHISAGRHYGSYSSSQESIKLVYYDYDILFSFIKNKKNLIKNYITV